MNRFGFLILSVFVFSFIFIGTPQIDLAGVETGSIYQSLAVHKAEAEEPVESRGLVPCGGTNQDPCQACHVVSLVNEVVAWLVGILGTIATIVIVYSGFKLVTSGGNVSVKEGAKSMITNIIIGYIIVLSAWLVIDYGAKMLVNEGVFGVWNEISCETQPKAESYDFQVVFNSSQLQDSFGSVSPLLAPELYLAGDCSPASLQGYGMTAEQARVFSCMAQPESGCNLNADNPDSSARGVFQILRGYNNTCHNLNLPACTDAAKASGYQVDGNLNCSRAFRGGYRIPGSNPLADACDAAASNMACNVAAALCLYKDSGYGPWLGDPEKKHHIEQRACVAKYAN